MHPISPGRTAWSVAPSGRGAGKRRPFIIATRRVDILRGTLIAAIGCSTRFCKPLESTEILLPSDPDGKAVTRSREPTIAVCDWIEEFPPGSNFETGGMVPVALLRTLFATAGLVLPPER